MSDLGELRERLHLDLERVLGAAAIAELDADKMREAIVLVLEIYDAEVAVLDEHGISADNRATYLAHAAKTMADKLRELQRVRISTEPLELTLDWVEEP